MKHLKKINELLKFNTPGLEDNPSFKVILAFEKILLKLKIIDSISTSKVRKYIASQSDMQVEYKADKYTDNYLLNIKIWSFYNSDEMKVFIHYKSSHNANSFNKEFFELLMKKIHKFVDESTIDNIWYISERIVIIKYENVDEFISLLNSCDDIFDEIETLKNAEKYNL